MSSRNTRLTPKQRAIAPQVYQALLQAKEKKGRLSIEEIIDEARHFFHQSPDFELDYFCIADATSLQPLYGKKIEKEARAFIAVKLGEIRLIDNVKF